MGAVQRVPRPNAVLRAVTEAARPAAGGVRALIGGLLHRLTGLVVRRDIAGGITVSMERPVPLLAVFSGPRERAIGLETDQTIHPRPVEAHLVRTRACPAGCSHCYVDAVPRPAAPEGDTQAMKRRLDDLARIGVFHCALGGGESVLADDILELAHHARSVGIVPSLTVSGLGVTAAGAADFRVFGRVNVSIDGIGDAQARTRGARLFDTARRAVGHLMAAGVPVGLNVVVTRDNIDRLHDIAAFARDAGVPDIELLRLKPTGRARAIYADLVPDPARYEALFPTILDLTRRYGITVNCDCSLVPFIACHDPGPETLSLWAVGGCEAGRVLLAVWPDGDTTGCSFLNDSLGDVSDLARDFDGSPAVRELRTWPSRAPEPCRSCRYLQVCRGGCRAVTLGTGGGPYDPDPECPVVRRYRATPVAEEAHADHSVHR